MGGGALAEVGAFTSVAIFVGRFGPAQIAAHQIAMNMASLLFMLPMGISSALTIRVGQYLGRRDPRAARFSAWTGVAIGLMIACVAVPLILVGRDVIVSFFSPDAGVRKVASDLMVFAAIWQLADATQVIAQGALRGYRVVLGPMLVMLLAFWVVGPPLGLRLGYYGFGQTPPMEIYGFWVGLVTALILAALCLSQWLRHIARKSIR
jgi:MATE family multidrug resistance protein